MYRKFILTLIVLLQGEESQTFARRVERNATTSSGLRPLRRRGEPLADGGRVVAG